MASKEVMTVTPEDINAHMVLNKSTADTLQWLIANAGIEMDDEAIADFVVMRGIRDNEIRNLWEFKAWCEKAAECIKTVTKHAYNVGGEDALPNNVSWSKQAYTYEFAEGAAEAVASTLIERGLVSPTQLYQQLTVSQVSKASGMTVEKIADLVPGVILQKPKERTLKIK